MSIKQKLITMILLMMTFLSIFPSQKAYAHDAYFLRVLINKSTMLYEGRVEFDDESFFSSEAKHAENKIGNFSSMKDGIAQKVSGLSSYSGSGSDAMMFAFPSKELGANLIAPDDKNHATDIDRARAMDINNVLIPSLNGLLVAINDGKSFTGNPGDFNAAIDAIVGASNGESPTFNGWKLTPNTSTHTIKITKTGRTTQEYPYRMIKGYNSQTLESKGPNGEADKSLIYDSDMTGDAQYITIGMLAAQANYSWVVQNITLSNLDEVRKPGVLERALGELLVAVVDGVESILGLYSIDELVFNRGSRMEHGSHEGVMKNGWMEISTSFFMIFQVIAWSVIGVALLKALLEKNLSTMSIVKQISLMSSIQNILIAGFLMTVFFLVFQTAVTMNSKMVGIFSSIAPQFQNMSTSGGNGVTLADGLLRVYYFFISLYLNFTYIMRGVTIAVLVASAPIFIVSIAFSSRGSELFSKWLRELIANLFLQTFHAFVMGMLLMVQIGATGIEMAVIALAVIPLTKLFKSLIVGEAGSLSGDVAGMAVGYGAGALAGMAKGKGGGGKGGYQGKSDGADETPGVGENPHRKEHSTDTPSSGETDKVKRTEGDSYGAVAGREGSEQKSDRFETSRVTPMSGADRAKSAFGKVKTAGKFAGAGAAFIGGAAMTSFGAGQAGGKMMDLGGGLGASGFSDTVDGVSSAGGFALNEAKEMINRRRDEMDGPDPGTIQGIETLANGDNVIHRRLQAMQAMGIDDAFTNGNEQAITYNYANLSEGMKTDLESWDRFSPEERKQRGVDNIVKRTDSQGNVSGATFYYNNFGKKQMGLKEAYRSNNRIVETKNHRHTADTRYAYNADSARIQDKGEDRNSGYSKN